MLCDTSGVGGFPLHFSTSPRVRPSGITRGYAWCVPSGDSGCRLGGFFFLSLSILPLHFFTSSLLQEFTLRASPAVTHGVSPPGTVGAGWEVSFFSPSPLSLSTSPRVRPSGITRGYAWCVPAGDSEWTMSYFFSYQEKQTLGRNVFSHSCGLICCAQKYNKGVS